MNCQPCNSNSPVTLQYYSSSYNDCGCESGDCGCNGTNIDSKCVFYTGPNLPCAQIETNQSLEDILIKIDQKLCSTLGNYSTYNKYCIDDDGAITTEQQFVEAISLFSCTLKTDFDTFKNTTYTAYQTTVDERFDAIEQPGIICGAANVVNTDSLETVLNKYCGAFSDIYSKLSLSTVSWDSCFTVNPDPTTIAEGFNVLIGQICNIQANGAGTTLPTFNNESSCLVGGTSNDTLQQTITLMKDRLCDTPTFDINSLTWGCTAKPTSIETDLQSAFDAVLGKLTYIAERLPTFSSDFTTELTDSGNACEGITVNIAPSGLTDTKVAIDGSDADPGTLTEKLIAGDGISLDTSTTPGTMIISSTNAAVTDVKVKSRLADPTAGYLEEKMEGSVNGAFTVNTSTNTTTNRVTVGLSVNFDTLWTALLEWLDTHPTMKEEFCERVTSCLPDCIIPPNVTVIYQDTDQTTTSTTTTTTTTV